MTLKEIYDKIVSCHAQFAQLQYDLLELDWEYGPKPGVDKLPSWAIDDCSSVQAQIGKLSEKFWALPEVSK
jgi:hypothetical protein